MCRIGERLPVRLRLNKMPAVVPRVTSVVAALVCDSAPGMMLDGQMGTVGLDAIGIVEGSMDREFILDLVENVLCPILNPYPAQHSLVIFDNWGEGTRHPRHDQRSLGILRVALT